MALGSTDSHTQESETGNSISDCGESCINNSIATFLRSLRILIVAPSTQKLKTMKLSFVNAGRRRQKGIFVRETRKSWKIGWIIIFKCHNLVVIPLSSLRSNPSTNNERAEAERLLRGEASQDKDNKNALLSRWWICFREAMLISNLS